MLCSTSLDPSSITVRQAMLAQLAAASKARTLSKDVDCQEMYTLQAATVILSWMIPLEAAADGAWAQAEHALADTTAAALQGAPEVHKRPNMNASVFNAANTYWEKFYTIAIATVERAEAMRGRWLASELRLPGSPQSRFVAERLNPYCRSMLHTVRVMQSSIRRADTGPRGKHAALACCSPSDVHALSVQDEDMNLRLIVLNSMLQRLLQAASALTSVVFVMVSSDTAGGGALAGSAPASALAAGPPPAPPAGPAVDCNAFIDTLLQMQEGLCFSMVCIDSPAAQEHLFWMPMSPPPANPAAYAELASSVLFDSTAVLHTYPALTADIGPTEADAMAAHAAEAMSLVFGEQAAGTDELNGVPMAALVRRRVGSLAELMARHLRLHSRGAQLALASTLQQTSRTVLALSAVLSRSLARFLHAPLDFMQSRVPENEFSSQWCELSTDLPEVVSSAMPSSALRLPLGVLRLQELCSAVLLHAPAAGAGGDDATVRSLASIGDVYLWSSAVGGVAAGVAGVWLAMLTKLAPKSKPVAAHTGERHGVREVPDIARMQRLAVEGVVVAPASVDLAQKPDMMGWQFQQLTPFEMEADLPEYHGCIRAVRGLLQRLCPPPQVMAPTHAAAWGALQGGQGGVPTASGLDVSAWHLVHECFPVMLCWVSFLGELCDVRAQCKLQLRVRCADAWKAAVRVSVQPRTNTQACNSQRVDFLRRMWGLSFRGLFALSGGGGHESPASWGSTAMAMASLCPAANCEHTAVPSAGVIVRESLLRLREAEPPLTCVAGVVPGVTASRTLRYMAWAARRRMLLRRAKLHQD